MIKDLTLSEIYNRESPFEDLIPGTSIVLIGRALIGPAMVPIKASESQDALMIFGVDSELSNAYLEAKMSGASDIYLIRINGTHAETNVQNAIKLSSLEAISAANSLQYEVITSGTNRYLTLINTEIGYNASYYLTGKTISQIVSEINIDAITFQSPVYATLTTEGSTDILVDEYFSSAQTDGANPQPGIVDIKRIIDMLEYLDTFPIAQIGILCSAFYDVYEDGYLFARLTEFVERKVRGCSPCIVTIGTDAGSVDVGVVFYLADRFKNNITVECPISEFINVILARPIFPTLHSTYVSNGVAAYCGIIDSAPYYEGTTNKRLIGATDDKVGLTNDEKTELANVGYIVLTTGIFNTEQQVRIKRGVNLSKGFNLVVDPDDPSLSYTRTIPAPMANVANVKLIQHIVSQLNDVLQTEEPTEISTLRARTEEVLDNEAEYIKEYNIEIAESLQGYAKTYVVSVEITPVGELSSIALTMQTQ